MEIEILLGRPSQFSAAQIQNFYKVVLSGDQVQANGLEELISAAALLAYASCNGEAVGTAALKIPRRSYVRRVFTKAGIAERYDLFHYELGWLVTLSQFEGNGISQRLIHAIMKSQTSQIFATTKNDRMRHILGKCGFQKTGNSYYNEANEKLDLYLSLSDKEN